VNATILDGFRGGGMSDKRAGGIMASSFVAGLLLTACIFAPRAWEPIPEPFFGLEEPGQTAPVEAAPAFEKPALSTAPSPAEAVVPERVEANPQPPAERLAMNPRPFGGAPAIAAQALPVPAPVEPNPPAVTAVVTQPPVSAVASPVAPPAVPVDNPANLRALVARVQSSRPPADAVPREPGLPRRISPPLAPERIAVPKRPVGAAETPAAEDLGAAPLPGEEWVDPDSVNWSDATNLHSPRKPSTVPVPRLGLRQRLRVGERFLGRDRNADGPAAAPAEPPVRETLPDIRVWPIPTKLLQQFELIASTASPAAESAIWAKVSLGRLRAVTATAGTGDPAAEVTLVALGESVHAGMGIADSSTDHAQAALVRRAALALSRRVAVWRAAAGLSLALARDRQSRRAEGLPAAHDPAADIRLEMEVARLIDALERFETSGLPEDAAVASGAIAMLEASSHPGAKSVAKAVQDHYLSANLRIAVHQQFLEKMMPETTVTTAPVDDVVMGRKVRGTRTVERSTTVRLTPDSDEICFELEVHGDVESRTVTDSGPASLTSHGDSSFTVHKPIKICPQGLLFGEATGVASNRSQLANVQTSFDSVPIMRSVVRNIVRNQHEENMPEANREVIDHIISKACREVDAQAEPRFAEMSERIRDRVWTPMVRLGLEPTPMAMETTQTTATLRLRLAADGQLAAHTPRPRAPGDSMLSLQVHESTVNNALGRLGLAGRRLSLESLISLLYERAGLEPRIPDDLPGDVEVTFAKSQPLRVECRDGLVHVRVALDAIESGRRNWYDIAAHVSYKISAAAPQVFLEREGPVQLSGPGHQGRVEFALRTIFSKIFPKERPIPVLPEKLTTNQRLAGMHVLQAVSTDGWFALAMGLRDPTSTVVKPPASPAKSADTRRPPLFR
jgi:hypothetical protein